MKLIVLVQCAVIAATLVQGKVLPDHLTKLLCRKSDPDYTKCVWQQFEKARPYFIKGIKETGLPPLDPFELPLVTVDRTINELVQIKAVLRNVKSIGASRTIIEDVKADPISHSGELRVTLPLTQLEMDYDVDGQLLQIPLKSKGHFSGNFTDTKMVVKGSLKTYQKDGEEFFRVDKIQVKAIVGDGHIKLTADNPELQFGADLISNFYNENPRRVMDAVNPIFVETANELFRVVSDQILAKVPAKEWLPE